jgi:hypothetical protein
MEFARNSRGTAARATGIPAPVPGRVALAAAPGISVSTAAEDSVAHAVQTTTIFRKIFTDSPLFAIYACMIYRPLTKVQSPGIAGLWHLFHRETGAELGI